MSTFAKKHNRIHEHTPGKVRYFTYYLYFPKDKDEWCAQIPFIHDLKFQLQQTVWRNDPNKCHDLITKGETSWKDHNGVRHRVVVEDVKRPKKWGINRHAALPGVKPGNETTEKFYV